MKRVSATQRKNNTKKRDCSQTQARRRAQLFETVVDALTQALSQELPAEASFGAFETSLLEMCNEAGLRILSNRLQCISERYESAELSIDNVRYRRHERGSVEYHSLCGSMKIERYTYRQADIRNGPTVVPMELASGLLERATPALAYRAALGDAQCPGRQWEEQLRASHRRPPSRSTLERMAKKIGDKVRTAAPEILPFVRAEEGLIPDAVALSVGLDRTTIPMEEKLRGPTLRDPKLKRRKKPYVRKKPMPVTVNYRMGYVGTVSIIGSDGESIQTKRYGCSADVDPDYILKMMMDDLIHLQTQRAALGKAELPMGIMQDGAPEMWTLVEAAAKRAFPEKKFFKGIDRFHLMERLAESLKALRDPRWTREVALDKWRKKLENEDAAIDDIELFIEEETNRQKRGKQLSVANAEILRTHLTYIDNNKHLMRYATLRENGLPTGSGATEGACKSLIMIRTKGCGQRWHSRGVNAVLALRGLYMSDRLSRFWNEMSNQQRCDIAVAA